MYRFRLKHFSAFANFHVFRTIYARILKYHIWIANEDLNDQYLFFLLIFLIPSDL